MNLSFPRKLFRIFAITLLLACTGPLAAQAAATSPDPRMFGPWVVQQPSSQEYIGLRMFFSPDGNFFMIDPKTQLGYSGSWVVGRSGLLVSIYGNGKWAKLWDADVSFASNDRMIVDVKDSQLSAPQRVLLQRMLF